MADREKPVANRAVAERYSKYVHALHRANISQMKPVINTTPPATLPHLSGARGSKRRQQEIERQMTIARDNRILIEKMERIRQTKSGPYAQQPYVKPSLNREARTRELMKIDRENLALYARIQARKPVLSTEEWKKHHVENEMRLKNISRFHYQPRITQSDLQILERTGTQRTPGITHSPTSTQRGSGRVPPSLPPFSQKTQQQHQQAQQAQAQQQQAHNTCVFSERGIRVGGIYSTLSVYERLRPFRLDFVARDDGGRSTLSPVSLPFRDLKRVFADRPDVLAPENTNLLVRCILPALWWHEQQAKFVLQLALDRIAIPSKVVVNEDGEEEVVLEGVPPTNVRPKCLDEESGASSTDAKSDQPASGDDCVYEFALKCTGLPNSPLTGECNPVIFVWKRTAKADGASGDAANDEKFVYIDRTECCLASPSPVFQKVVGITLTDADFRAALKGEGETEAKGDVTSTYRFDACEMVNGQAQDVLGAADVAPSALAALVLNHFKPGATQSPDALVLTLFASQAGEAAASGAQPQSAGSITITFSPPRRRNNTANQQPAQTSEAHAPAASSSAAAAAADNDSQAQDQQKHQGSSTPQPATTTAAAQDQEDQYEFESDQSDTR